MIGFRTGTSVIGKARMYADLALIAVATEAVVGYPDIVYRWIGHPVTWLGVLIARCDRAWNSEALSFGQRRLRGVGLLLLLLIIVAIITVVVLRHALP